MSLKGVMRVGNTTSLLSGKGACSHPILSLHWNSGGAANHCWGDWEFRLPIRPPLMPPRLGQTRGLITVHWHLGVEEMTSLTLGSSESPDSLARLPLTSPPPECVWGALYCLVGLNAQALQRSPLITEGGSSLPVSMKSLVPYLDFSDTPMVRAPLTSLNIAWPEGNLGSPSRPLLVEMGHCFFCSFCLE